ncbi:uncharacterized protein BDR25DRAFT_256396, partial [Lindgomyces ingoldianus]
MKSRRDITAFGVGSMAFLALLLAKEVGANGFNRDECVRYVRDSLSQGILAKNATCFFRDNSGMPMSDPDYPTVTLAGCNQLCGSSRGWYKDIGPRLSTWLIPVVLLLSNMEVSPLDKRRYLMLAHLVGDPIDSLWSLLLKLEAWSRCHNLAKAFLRVNDRRLVRNLATVLGGIEELVGFHTNPLSVYRHLVAHSTLDDEELSLLIGKTAQRLSDSRTDERLRTLFTTALYFYQLVSAFIATVGGGNTSPPGGRIGTAMFMTWVVPSILLSNAIGTFTSSRTCFTILERFYQDSTGQFDLWAELQRTCPQLRQYPTIDDYFDSLTWSGAIYTYRPNKRLPFATGAKDRSPVTLLMLATSPIIVASVISSAIIYHTPPIAFSCRNVLIISLAAFQLLSPLFTWLTSR